MPTYKINFLIKIIKLCKPNFNILSLINLKIKSLYGFEAIPINALVLEKVFQSILLNVKFSIKNLNKVFQKII